MMEKMNRRSFLGASLLALCIPSKLFAEEESNNVVLRFAALSDVHYDKSHNDASAERVRFAKALQFMNEYQITALSKKSVRLKKQWTIT